MNIEKRNTKMSTRQKNALVEYLQNREELVSGKFSSTFSLKDAQAEWARLALTLNSIPGSVKDWRHWRKSWQDIKKFTKYKQPNTKKHAQEEEAVFEILGPTPVEDHIDDHIDILKSDITFVKIEDIGIPLQPQPNPEELHVPETSQPSVSQQSEAAASNLQKLKTKSATGKLKRRTVLAHRLSQTLCATENLVYFSEQKLKMKESYYTKKLELMRELLSLKRRSVLAKERIATSLKKLLKK